MGEKGGGNKNNVVLKLDLHCEGCVMRITKAVRHFQGVEDVKANMSANELIVIGKVDAAMLQVKLAKKTRKKIEIISQPKEDGAAEESPDKKSEEENKPKKIKVVLKTGMNCVCDGCIQKVEKLILKVKGAESASFGGNKESVTVEGTMDAEELVSYMSKKLKRKVEVVQPKKEEKNEGEGESGGKENKEEENGRGEMEGEAEFIKIDHHGYDYGYNGHFMYPQNNNNNNNNNNGYVNEGSMVEPLPFIMIPQLYPHPQMFSDENPNACSVM